MLAFKANKQRCDQIERVISNRDLLMSLDRASPSRAVGAEILQEIRLRPASGYLGDVGGDRQTSSTSTVKRHPVVFTISCTQCAALRRIHSFNADRIPVAVALSCCRDTISFQKKPGLAVHVRGGIRPVQRGRVRRSVGVVGQLMFLGGWAKLMVG